MPKKSYVQICPKCKSTDVFMDHSNPLQGAMGLPPNYVCNNCNHTSHVFPEVDMSKKKLKVNSKAKKNKVSKVDTSVGDFDVRVTWKVAAPLLVLLGIIAYFAEPAFGIFITLLGLGMCYITFGKKRNLKD